MNFNSLCLNFFPEILSNISNNLRSCEGPLAIKDQKELRSLFDNVLLQINELRMNPKSCVSILQGYLSKCRCKSSGGPCKDCLRIIKRIRTITPSCPTKRLEFNDALCEAARERADELKTRETKDNDATHSNSFLSRLSAKGDWTWAIGEIIEVGTGGSLWRRPEECLAKILSSEGGAWENLFCSRFLVVGMGLATLQRDSFFVLHFASDFGPPLKKAPESKFCRYLEVSAGKMTEEVELVLNCVPFTDLRSSIRKCCENKPEVVIKIEYLPGEIQVCLIENGVSKALHATWEMEFLGHKHRAVYHKYCEWGNYIAPTNELQSPEKLDIS